MYAHFFRLSHEPFSISPDPRYLFMSQRHHEALAHLLYGAAAGGGVVVLSGEIGTGKTTVCRCLLEQLPANCSVAYIFNPKLTVAELLQSICEEFRIPLANAHRADGVKDYIDALNRHLLAAHGEGRNSVLIIDEAQNLSIEVLEQLRLLTNLETNERKLLQIILIGQPELRDKLARPELEQLAQRVIARYHLQALSPQETGSYIQHRLSTAGLSAASPFQQPLMRHIHRLTKGIPRRINLLCDRALLGAYACGRHEVDRGMLEHAAHELFDDAANGARRHARRRQAAFGTLAAVLVAGAAAWAVNGAVPHKAAGDSGIVPASAAAAESAPAAPVTPAAGKPSMETTAQAGTGLILSEQDGAPAPGLPGKSEALRQLAQAWHVSPPKGASCQTIRQSGLRCYEGNGGLAELRQLNRPAVLKLRSADGVPYYAILDGLADTYASLRTGSVRQVVSLVVLSHYFSGEFSTLWRLPPDYGEIVVRDDKGTEVDWIAAQLARANHRSPPAGAQQFDTAMLTQVREFQRAQGLDVDGVVGPATLMQLNRIAGKEEPRLRTGLALTPTLAASGE